MKRKLNITAALATTASVALLAGVAHAQMGGTPQVCTTTLNSPAHQNCVMPTASAPGGGSFPGSFLVPGTNTSFAVHGYIQVDAVHDFGPHLGDTGFAVSAVPLDGPGSTSEAAHAANGGTALTVKATRPNIETRTPTAYGELKTYIEFDFNQTGSTQLGGNNDLLRLRQAYGTLGPWLIGQTYSLFADLQAYADTAAGAQDAGMFNTFNVRRPMVRYTWLVGNGMSIAGGAEMPTYTGNGSYATAADGAALTSNNPNDTTSYVNWPHFVGAGELDQPWGHVRLALATGVNEARLTDGPTTAHPNKQNGFYALALSGHLNTWGKDALRGAVGYNNGGSGFSSDMQQGGTIYNTVTGASTNVKEWFAYASYEHFFTGQWRANESFGYVHNSGNPGFTEAATLVGLEKVHFTNNLNVIYSPVPQLDMILEWQHAYRKVNSGAKGTDNAIDAQWKFYF